MVLAGLGNLIGDLLDNRFKQRRRDKDSVSLSDLSLRNRQDEEERELQDVELEDLGSLLLDEKNEEIVLWCANPSEEGTRLRSEWFFHSQLLEELGLDIVFFAIPMKGLDPSCLTQITEILSNIRRYI